MRDSPAGFVGWNICWYVLAFSWFYRKRNNRWDDYNNIGWPPGYQWSKGWTLMKTRQSIGENNRRKSLHIIRLHGAYLVNMISDDCIIAHDRQSYLLLIYYIRNLLVINIMWCNGMLSILNKYPPVYTIHVFCPCIIYTGLRWIQAGVLNHKQNVRGIPPALTRQIGKY